MVVGEASINNIMGGIENTGSVRLHNHKRKLKQRFDIIKKLGQGTYGKVQLGINKETGQEVAIKTIKKSKIETEADLIRIRREIQIMSSVQHPNIIHIYEVFENREKMVLVMEYAAGGELYDYLSERKVLVEEEARRIFRQISTACYYCHKHKICHRDLKLENILLDENKNAKIADFGLSNVFDDQRLLSTFCGSPLYASPEIVKGTPYHGPEVDCWSIGVLLYTLVYGAMPFDGSNFKRLVKQISQGDYFEPKNPSPASPLIQEMLTVNPKNRANIEKICAHWWVNEGYDDSCLEISEELANQTPVRLDVLLSLNPPPSQMEGDKLVVTGEAKDDQINAAQAAPTRSQSVGSLMEVTNPAERRIQELIAQELKGTPKRKLETTVSSDQANLLADVKKKEKISKENTVADISMRGRECKPDAVDIKTNEISFKNGTETQDPSLQGAACTELLEEAKKNEIKKPQKVKKTLSTSISNKILEEINENPSQESLYNKAVPTQDKGKENIAMAKPQPVKLETKEEKEVKSPVKKKVVKKKVLADKNEEAKPVDAEKKEKPIEVQEIKEEPKEIPAEAPSKPVERRQSRIFEQAEKFQSMISSNDNGSKTQVVEKPKKIVIPGVSVGGFKKEFERKASLKSVSPPKLKTTMSKKHIIEDKLAAADAETKLVEKNDIEQSTAKAEAPKPSTKLAADATEDARTCVDTERPATLPVVEDDRKLKMKNAVSIISNALDKEGTRKSKSRPCMTRKPPVPFGFSGRSASGSIAMISPMSPPSDSKRYSKIQMPLENRTLPLSSTPEQVINQPEPSLPENKTSSAEITLKSATLPRRKSAKAEIQLDYPKVKPATMEFKTEMAHQVQAPPTLTTQRSEVMFPVNAPHHNIGLRSSSLEPESRVNQKERIIPIAFEVSSDTNKETLQSPPPKPPVPRSFSSQKSMQRSNSLSRQSTQESDSETTVSGDPIKKSPREYIIPIAVEGGGYVTPRAGSLEPSDTSSTVANSSRKTSSSKFSRPRRMMSFFDRDGSEDESPFGTLHRHSSFGKDSDNESDSRKDAFHMHRLRSSRPRKSNLEHNDSLSSGEDDDDDDGFEFLTAENLFSTLLSRVRDLTHRINDDGSRPGFPNSRLLSHFDHGSNFWNRMEPLGSHNSPLGRQFSRERSVNSSSSIPWRRSVSRDLATDIESVFSDPKRTPSPTTIVPRGDNTDRKDTLNLSDLNLRKLKLTEEDALALSYLTPGLSRRIQKQLFASLPPSEARKISRTLSMRNENEKPDTVLQRRSVDRISSTLPRKFSFDKYSSSQQNLTCDINQNNFKDKETNNSNSKSQGTENIKPERSYLPTKSKDTLYSQYTDKSSRSDTYEVRKSDGNLEPTKLRSKYSRSSSLREPSDYRLKSHTYSLRSPDSSLSEMSSIRDDDSYGPETTSISKYMHPTHVLEHTKSQDNSKSESKPVRKISRFLRPDFYDSRKEENVVVKEKKEREMETQKVLKEIRDKRIKNRLTMRRERSLSREKSLEKESITKSDTQNHIDIRLNENISAKTSIQKEELLKIDTDIRNNNIDAANITNGDAKISEDKQIIKCGELVQALTSGENKSIQNLNDKDNLNIQTYKDTDSLLQNVSDNIKNIESNVLSNAQNTKKESVVKKDRASKLIRPKSYPAENGFKNDKDPKVKPVEKTADLKANKTTKLKKTPVSPKSLEKPSTKNKFLHSIEKKIEKLRTLNTDEKTKEEKKSGVETAIKRLRDQSVPRNVDHITESTLIKRAVSVEDFSNVKQKSLQPSRKSVTKILSLFKKYEEKEPDKTKVDDSQLKNGADPTVMLNNINESNIPTVKSKLNSSHDSKSPERVLEPNQVERPKSLYFDKVKRYNSSSSRTDNGVCNDVKQKTVSKLPVNSYRKSLNLESKNCEDDQGNNNVISDEILEKKSERKNLKLDFSNINDHSQDVNLNRISYTTDESSNLLSPCDETLSCDSWSVCSDFHHTQDLVSPISPNGNLYNSGDDSESVIDRIRRKSFYTRFNEKKKPRKSLIGNYKDLDLYKDLSQKSLPRYKAPTNEYSSSSSYRRNSGYSSSCEGEHEYRPYVRSKSVANDYAGVPNRYQTYNPRRSNISSLYSSMSEDSTMEDVSTTGLYKKYSYNPNTSRLGSLSRTIRSPSSDFQYVPHPHRSASEHSSISSPTENSQPMTEHAV